MNSVDMAGCLTQWRERSAHVKKKRLQFQLAQNFDEIILDILLEQLIVPLE